MGEFVAKITQFFKRASNECLHAFIEKLRKMFDILKTEHRFRWFSCSLLFVYEGFGLRNEEENECKNKDTDSIKLTLKLIDFTNFVIVKNYLTMQQKEKMEVGNEEEICQLDGELDTLDKPDYGILFGLESLIALLVELKEFGNIKRRSEKEWNAFVASLCCSKMALRPFANEKIFNQNTTI